MNYFSEQDIRDIVASVLAGARCAGPEEGMEVPVEISARHVHLNRQAMDALFGEGSQLTWKRDLSQPGQFLSEERVKLVTERGQIASVGILGPLREENQVELSLTDARTLGVKPPIALSGHLEGADDVIMVGPKGVYIARGSVIVAKAHVHMTEEDGRRYGVTHGQRVSIRLGQDRPVTLNDVIVRISPDYRLAVHIDYDEANAARLSGGHIVGRLLKNG